MTIEEEISDKFEQYVKDEIPNSLHGFNWSVSEVDGVILDSDSLPSNWGVTSEVNLENHISKFNYNTRFERKE